MRIIQSESQNSLGWKGPLKVIESNTPAKSRDTFLYIRLLRVLTNLTLNLSRHGLC